MKYFNQYFLILIFVCESLFCEESEHPEQTACLQLSAIPKKPFCGRGSKTELWIGKVLTNKSCPSSAGTEVITSCSPYDFSCDCGTIRMEITIDTNGQTFVKTAAHNTKSGDKYCYEEDVQTLDDYYHIWTTSITKMKQYVAVDQNTTEIVNLASELKAERENGVALIHVSPKLEFALYATCDRKHAWVGFSDSVMQEEEFDNLKQAVNDAIKNAGFNPAEFVDITTNVSENFDFCISPNITSQ